MLQLGQVQLDVVFRHARVYPGLWHKGKAADLAGLVEGISQCVVRKIDAFVFLLLIALLQRLEYADDVEGNPVDGEVFTQWVFVLGE